jgi:hypothetical protein
MSSVGAHAMCPNRRHLWILRFYGKSMVSVDTTTITENMRWGTSHVPSTHINESKESIGSTNPQSLSNPEAIRTNDIVVISEYKRSGLTGTSTISIIKNSPS